MKLVTIWNASNAWATLSALKKNPKLAYRLLKYQKKVIAEHETCEAQRQKYVYEISGAEPGSIVALTEGTPEFADFLAKFNEFLQGDSDLEVVGISMDELIEALDAEKGNVLSGPDLDFLEPFFEVRQRPDLKAVS